MFRSIAVGVVASLMLNGCGLAGMGGAAATEGAAAAEEAKAGQRTLDKVNADLEAAQKTAADARAEAEKASQ